MSQCKISEYFRKPDEGLKARSTTDLRKEGSMLPIRRYGYRMGVILGLLLYALGAFLFVPGSKMMSFEFFLFSLFIIGCGLTCLETADNPYVTVLGEPESGAGRLNLAQSMHGLGWVIGPLADGLILFVRSGCCSTLASEHLPVCLVSSSLPDGVAW